MKLSRLLLICCIPWRLSSTAANAASVRTRFTFLRPTRDNASSLLFGHTINNNSSGSQKRQQQNDGIKFNHDEVGITKPLTGGSDIYPSCVGYTKTMRKQGKLQKQKIGGDVESNGDDATTICSNKTIDGWRVLRFYKRVGQGKNCYTRVQNAVFNWDFEAHYENKSMGIVSAKTQKEEGDLDISLNNKEDNTADCTAPRRSLLATFTEICLPKPLKPFFVVNPVHVVYEVKDKRHPKFVYSSTAYATMSGHLLSGEERVTVVWRNGVGGEVDVEIVSFSRSAPSLVGKIIWPLIGRMQTQFFLSELDHLDNVANDRRIKQ